MPSTEPSLSTRIAPPASFPEHVRGMLEEAILSGRLAPGRRVTENELAEMFGVSRTPVREAMRLLAAQGLVVHQRGRGTHVATRTTPDEAAIIYQLRMPLESYLTSLAAEHISASELHRLDHVQREFRGTLRRKPLDRQRLVRLDSDFHRTIYGASQSDLVSIFNSYWFRFLRELSGHVYRHERLERFADQHDEILDALHAHDVAQARDRMNVHLRTGFETFDEVAASSSAG